MKSFCCARGRLRDGRFINAHLFDTESHGKVFNMSQVMKTEKKKGRPRKNGAIEPRQFGRAILVISAYDQARKSGEKHSAAVNRAVDFLRQNRPEIPISGTGVKRILADIRSKRSPKTLLVESCRALGTEAEKISEIAARLAVMRKDGSMAQSHAKINQQQSFAKFTCRIGDRPDYPRHNRRVRKKSA